MAFPGLRSLRRTDVQLMRTAWPIRQGSTLISGPHCGRRCCCARVAARLRRDPPLDWPPHARIATGRCSGSPGRTMCDARPGPRLRTRALDLRQHLFETLVTTTTPMGSCRCSRSAGTSARTSATIRFELYERDLLGRHSAHAADAVGSLERVLDPGHGRRGGVLPRHPRCRTSSPARRGRRGSRRPRATTLTIELDEPDPLFLEKLALLFASSCPPSARADSATTSPTSARQRPFCCGMAPRRAARAGRTRATAVPSAVPRRHRRVHRRQQRARLAPVPERRDRRRRHSPADSRGGGDPTVGQSARRALSTHGEATR